ncbi:hypothetical protein BH09BAC5_BH09BAC5_11880 [soil metagenome]
MKSDSQKLELIEWLTKLNDKAILSSLLFFKKSNESLDWADNLSIEQRNRVEEGLQDIKTGKTVSNGKVMAKYGRKS